MALIVDDVLQAIGFKITWYNANSNRHFVLHVNRIDLEDADELVLTEGGKKILATRDIDEINAYIDALIALDGNLLFN